MKRLLILIAWLVLVSPVFAAITERYVSSLAAGGGSGTSGSPWTFAEMLTNAAAGDRCNVKADGTYTLAQGLYSFINVGTTSSPIIIRGYKVTPGDGYLGRTNYNGPLITTNMPLIQMSNDGSGGGNQITFPNYCLTECLRFDGTTKTNQGLLQVSGAIRFCKIVNNATNTSGAQAVAAGSTSLIAGNDCSVAATGGTSGAIGALSNSQTIIYNRASGGGAAIIVGIRVPYLIGWNVLTGAVNGISVSTGTLNAHCNTITGNSGDGIAITGSTANMHVIQGNVITDNGGWGINLQGTGSVYLLGNRYRDNTSGNISAATDYGTGPTIYGSITTDTGGPESDYRNAAGGDYRLTPSSPARAAGWFPFADIGALQSQSGQVSHVFAQ